MEHEFNHQPTIEEVKNIITEYYNHITNQKILTGFSFQGNAVRLSTENQFNYKTAYELAVQTNGATLRIRNRVKHINKKFIQSKKVK